MRLPCGYMIPDDHRVTGRIEQRATGGRGRIRTFVARKERQIYSLLVLATHPPVPKIGTRTSCPKIVSLQQVRHSSAETQNGLVSKDTSPFNFDCWNCSRLTPLPNSWWSWRRELNPRPSDYKSDALPAELRQRRSNRVRIADSESELQGAGLEPRAVRQPGCGNSCPYLLNSIASNLL